MFFSEHKLMCLPAAKMYLFSTPYYGALSIIKLATSLNVADVFIYCLSSCEWIKKF